MKIRMTAMESGLVARLPVIENRYRSQMGTMRRIKMIVMMIIVAQTDIRVRS